MNSGRTVFPATDPASAPQGISEVCGPPSWRPLRQGILLLGSVSGDGLRAIHLSREPARHRDLPARSISGKLYHMGFRSNVARSTLADANESHDWRIFADFAQRLIATARRCTPAIRWASIWIRACMRWTPRPSISAWPCFRGPSFASARPRSRCTRCWICAAIFPRLSTSPTARCMM